MYTVGRRIVFFFLLFGQVYTGSLSYDLHTRSQMFEAKFTNRARIWGMKGPWKTCKTFNEWSSRQPSIEQLTRDNAISQQRRQNGGAAMIQTDTECITLHVYDMDCRLHSMPFIISYGIFSLLSLYSLLNRYFSPVFSCVFRFLFLFHDTLVHEKYNCFRVVTCE